MFPSKVEIKLKKAASVNWPSLEKTDCIYYFHLINLVVVLPTSNAPSTSSSSSLSFSTSNWDKFCEENKEEV